jgi:hypothetical protein
MATLQLATGIWVIYRSSLRQGPGALLWLVIAAYGALLAWMVAVDTGPWLRSRLRNRP